jgi:small subunit ribosomal protein S4
MGDPKKARKKYTKPSHPWQRMRIEKEREIRKIYGVRIKKEIWKMDSLRKNFTDRVKALVAGTTEQHRKEREQIVQRLVKLGLVSPTSKFDDILGLTLEDIMGRRLQTLVWKKGLAKTAEQARQFITHGHITVAGKRVTSPSHIVTLAEESQIAFLQTSALADPEHPERIAKRAEMPAQAPAVSAQEGSEKQNQEAKPARVSQKEGKTRQSRKALHPKREAKKEKAEATEAKQEASEEA